MLSGVGVICFAASFAAALIFFLIGAVTGRGWGKRIAAGVLAAGLTAETAYLYHHFIVQNGQLVVSASGWFYVLAWGLALAALWLFLTAPKMPYALFLLPISLLAIGIGALQTGTEFTVQATMKTLKLVHGVSLAGSATLLFLGCLSGLMYFLQAARLKNPQKWANLPHLPSLERLEKTLRRAVGVSTGLLGCGIVCGFYMNHLRSAAGTVVPFTDFLVAGATLLFLFLTGALAFTRLDETRAAKRTAFLTIACTLALVLILAVGALDPNTHWRFSADADAVPADTSSIDTVPVDTVPAGSVPAVSAPVMSSEGETL